MHDILWHNEKISLMGKNKSVCLQGEMLTVVGYVNSLNQQVNITLYVNMWIC